MMTRRFSFNVVLVSLVLGVGTAAAQHTHAGASEVAAGGDVIMSDADARVHEAPLGHRESIPLQSREADLTTI